MMRNKRKLLFPVKINVIENLKVAHEDLYHLFSI